MNIALAFYLDEDKVAEFIFGIERGAMYLILAYIGISLLGISIIGKITTYEYINAYNISINSVATFSNLSIDSTFINSTILDVTNNEIGGYKWVNLTNSSVQYIMIKS